MADIGETPSAGIGAMLREHRFLVPSHQRDYSWTKDEIDQLFIDIQGAMSRNEEEYFLGLMVCIPNNGGTLTVLDGQQRLATTVIFLSAVRAWLKDVADFGDTVRMIRDDFIGRAELGEKTLLPKLNLNSENNSDFQQYVVNDSPISDVKNKIEGTKRNDRNYNLLNAIVICHDWVLKIAGDFDDSQKAATELIEMVKYFRDSVRVVRFQVRDDNRAYTIFETLNDRGLDLTTLDLVKNYLFGEVAKSRPERLRELEDRWGQMMSTLSNVKANDFLKAFWTSRHGRTQKENLFKDLKRLHNSFSAALSLSVEFLEVAEQYSALDSRDDTMRWSQKIGQLLKVYSTG